MYYDGTKILSLKDANGNKPEIYIISTNRSAGKTTFFNRYAVKKFINYGEKFMLLYRYKYEIENCENKFFNEIKKLFFPTYNMISKSKEKGVYKELFLVHKDKEYSCGYALSLNSANTIKKISHYFTDVKRIIFDEFQSEDNIYLPNEINKFLSVHLSIARGNGDMSRYVPVIMISNPVSIINPYYIALGISDKLKSNTKYLRGNGYVLEQQLIESAIKAQQKSTFNEAFSNTSYINYSTKLKYLSDNNKFIENIDGEFNYICTLIYNEDYFSIKNYYNTGIIYIDSSYDITYPVKLALTLDDHSTNFVLLKSKSLFVEQMKDYFNNGLIRFKNQKCKSCFMELFK